MNTPSLQLYDATLRDGMQGEGMSLSADEKVRVAHKLDELGIDLIEAGFPSSNPKERELFGLLAGETFAHAQIAAFGMTRRRDVAAAEDEGLRVLADCFAPVCTLVGKTWTLHLEKVVRVDREENLRMIADSVAFLVGEGKRVIYDAEHFFDGWRRSRLRVAVRARRRRGRGRDRGAVRHQRLLPARPGRRRHGGEGCARARRGRCGSRSTATTTPSAAWPTRWPRWRPGPRRCRAR